MHCIKTEVVITTLRTLLSLQSELFHLTIRSTILHVFLTLPMHAACPGRLVYFYLNILICRMTIPVPVRSKAWVCARSPAETLASNPTWAWRSASCERCVLSGKGLCNGLITRPDSPTDCRALLCVI
jgi:hypothetical protein